MTDQVTVERADLLLALRFLRQFGKPCERDNCDGLVCLAVRRLTLAFATSERAS